MSAHSELNPSLRPRLDRAGFTIIELLTVMLIIGLLASIAGPALKLTMDKARVARAIGDIEAVTHDLAVYETADQPLPATLSSIGRGALLDPWGRPYTYVTWVGAPPAAARKDRFGVVLNSRYDLYSSGKDGSSAIQLDAGVSLDDIVRASDGSYIGLGATY
jgi:general secretion pathway protein G